MTTYIAFLRGINVGGKNIVKMADLKRVFESIGFCEVQTYIQSGNVLFKSDEDEEYLCGEIEHEIEAAFGLSVTVVLRTAAELGQIVSNCPFSKDEVLKAEASSKVQSLYVSLLAKIPPNGKTEQMNACRSESEDYRIIGREVFLLLHQGIRNSKLVNNLNRLNMPSTVRNWTTINKLYMLAKTMED